ncbi:TonB-dependent receptor [Moraxella sp. VT-16-12]|uniref:TonB-dependent receptor n=1 Tax=Moraxella sp. VT-16-12 TaxID=2014877 RepID=UPI000B7E8E20|nr:TonB-dependent receptor [Moraxella sp. VT-16-12]TWV83969.1 TonB-dependent receptor [Moraxella sp. VT-16-12]
MIKKPLVCAICSVFAMSAMAQTEDEPNVVLDVLVATLQDTQSNSGFVFKDSKKASDTTVSKAKLKHRSATLGNALSDELGVHSNPFGGGASAPVIRGQDGVRVKILQNGTDVIDVSSMSPDHVVAADTLLAERVELVRGAPTLLYSTASMAGVVNVVDGRIPSAMPAGGVLQKTDGEAMLRYNTNSDEKLVTAGINFGVGENIAVRVEGLSRRANEYEVPHFQADKVLDYLPGSDNKSTVATVGVSYVADKGFVGASYSRREDKYGIPGHIHCNSNQEHFIRWYGSGRYYIPIYPHLMTDEDINDNPHTHCQHNHDEPSINNPTGVPINHEHDSPWIDMKTDRYDVRGELNYPIKGLDKIKLSLTYADYYHDEKDPGNVQDPNNKKSAERDTTVDKGSASSIFTKKGINSRLEFYHTPTSRLRGVFGVQYQTQKSSAGEVLLPSHFESGAAYDKALHDNINQYRPYLLVPNTNKSLSFFGLEQAKFGNITLEAAARYEKQKTPIEYSDYLLQHALNHFKDPARPSLYVPQHPDLSPYKQNAFSYATTVLWDMTNKHRLSLSYSHNERIPSPMELYYQGRHLATSSFEHGNKNLTKEKSNNYEIGIAHTGNKFDYKASGYYSDFDNYIFNENIEKEGNLYLRRYNQTTAKIYGLEGELTYHLNPNHSFTLFGDMVRGKIGALKPVIGKNFYDKDPILDEDSIDGECLLRGGDLSKCVSFLNQPVAPPTVALDPSCSKEDIKDAPDICVLVYPAKLSTDMLERPATNAPRIPPSRLGFRWQGYLNDKWSANLEFSHIFSQKRVFTSTIAIKPELRTPAGCQRDDDECEIKDYVNPDNPLAMQPRLVVENKTAGYNLLNVGVDYDNMWKNVDYTLSLRANNLLNEKIYIHNSFLPYVPQMGRNVTLGLTVKF